MQAADRLRLQRALVWLCRIIVGLTFVISGWAKAIDPWGTLIKVEEYLTVWGLSLPRELTLTGCIALACIEFCTGVLVATGALRRLSVITAGLIMLFMLPLSLYIAIANPVTDCGCFGDFIILSNGATFAKNVVLAALIAYLIIKNTTIKGLYAPPIQWLEIAVSLAFPLLLAFYGYNIQPMLDFRTYKIGTGLFAASEGVTGEKYIYEKDGERRSFDLAELPDSSWSFVDMEMPEADNRAGFEILDEDGEDVSEDLAARGGEMLLLVVPDPGVQFLSRAHLTNELYRYSAHHGVDMVAIVGETGPSLERWKDLTYPRFPVYSATSTALKQLVRGDAALVYTIDGEIKWKRTLASLPPDIVTDTDASGNMLRNVRPVDDGRLHTVLASAWLVSMLIIYLLSLSPKILRCFVRQTKKNA